LAAAQEVNGVASHEPKTLFLAEASSAMGNHLLTQIYKMQIARPDYI
jgi:hypothetical protein